MEYLSISQVAEKWGIKQRRIRVLCAEGRIPGAFKMGAYWSVPINAEKPLDARVKSGKYIKNKQAVYTDNHTPEQRRRNMQVIKSSGSKIEVLLERELWSRGLRYKKNVKGIIGKPDIVFVRDRIAVFCDSEFWHGYNWEERKNDFKSNKDFWISKIERNIERDHEVTEGLEKLGWIVIRFWGEDIMKNTTKCANIVEHTLKMRRSYNERF